MISTSRPLVVRRLLLLSLAALPLAGCRSGSTVTGKVIPGEVSFIGVVDASDKRLKDPGIPGVEVAAGTDPSRPVAAAVLGRGTSDKSGNVVVRIKDEGSYAGPFAFNATKDGYVPATGLMPIPSTDRRLLVILKPASAGAPAAPAPQRPR